MKGEKGNKKGSTGKTKVKDRGKREKKGGFEGGGGQLLSKRKPYPVQKGDPLNGCRFARLEKSAGELKRGTTRKNGTS